jgi:hypothetical protein
MANCFGLHALHAFLAVPFLAHKRAVLTRALECNTSDMGAAHKALAAVKTASYEEFSATLEATARAEIAAREAARYAEAEAATRAAVAEAEKWRWLTGDPPPQAPIPGGGVGTTAPPISVAPAVQPGACLLCGRGRKIRAHTLGSLRTRFSRAQAAACLPLCLPAPSCPATCLPRITCLPALPAPRREGRPALLTHQRMPVQFYPIWVALAPHSLPGVATSAPSSARRRRPKQPPRASMTSWAEAAPQARRAAAVAAARRPPQRPWEISLAALPPARGRMAAAVVVHAAAAAAARRDAAREARTMRR